MTSNELYEKLVKLSKKKGESFRYKPESPEEEFLIVELTRQKKISRGSYGYEEQVMNIKIL